MPQEVPSRPHPQTPNFFGASDRLGHRRFRRLKPCGAGYPQPGLVGRARLGPAPERANNNPPMKGAGNGHQEQSGQSLEASINRRRAHDRGAAVAGGCGRGRTEGAGGRARISAGAVGGHGPQHHRGVPIRWSPGRLSARRPARPRRPQRLGHRDQRLRRIRRLRHLGGGAGGRAFQLLLRLVRIGQRSDLQVGNLPDQRTARLPGEQGRAFPPAMRWSASPCPGRRR